MFSVIFEIPKEEKSDFGINLEVCCYSFKGLWEGVGLGVGWVFLEIVCLGFRFVDCNPIAGWVLVAIK